MSHNKSLKKFCRLTKYIEQNNPDLYQVIEDLCIGHYFKPSRDSNGITFLFPDKTYAQKIINAAYSTDPDVAVNMFKSLLVHGFHSSTADFKNGVVNLLNQKIDIADADDTSAKLANGLVLKRDEAFVPMSYRENMAVFSISGKGEIGTDGERVAHERVRKTGGNHNLFSKKGDLHKLLEDKYAEEINNSDTSNIYVKKVCLQLAAVSSDFPKDQIAHCLGNDEFSDSYLLDMYCEKNCPALFNTLCKALCSDLPAVTKITFDNYVAEKKKVVGEAHNNKNVSRGESHLKGLHSPIDVRTKVCNIYGRDKHKLGIDLFIVFCNISKDLWKNDSYNKENEFRQFAYIASKIYTKPEDLVNQEFDPARDLTLYGNLLKSDVLKFVAQADFRSPECVSHKVVTSLPSPLEMSLFSLCYLTNHHQIKVTGGDAEVEALLRKLS